MTSVSNEILEVNMNKTLSTQKRKITTIRNQNTEGERFSLRGRKPI